jgi:hypothetical protein
MLKKSDLTDVEFYKAITEHEFIVRLVPSVLYPGTFIWIWQEAFGAILEAMDKGDL